MKTLRTFKTIIFAVLILGFVGGAGAQGQAQDFCDRGRKLMEAGRYLEAAEAYKQAIRLLPDLEPAHLGLQKAYGSITSREQTEEAHRLLERLAPDDAVGHYGLGLLYVQKRDMGYAQDEYKILQNLDPALAQRLDQAICQRK